MTQVRSQTQLNGKPERLTVIDPQLALLEKQYRDPVLILIKGHF